MGTEVEYVTAYDGFKVRHAWFEREHMQTWAEKIKPLGPFKRYIECGLAEGSSFVWVIDNLLAEDGVAVGVDRWTHRWVKKQPVMDECKRTFFERIKRYPLWKTDIYQTDTFRALILMNHNGDGGPRFDLAYQDASHWGRGVIEDLVLLFPLLKIGAVLVIDDVDRDDFRQRHPRAKTAAEAFLSLYRNYVRLVFRTNKQLCLRKTKA